MQEKGEIKWVSYFIVRPILFEKVFEAVHKPNSVLGNHLSGIPITRNLNRPTRESNEAGHFSSPIWSFSGRGLPCHLCHQRCGELLPRLFTLTPIKSGRYVFCDTFLLLTKTGCYPASCPVEFGLSSSAFKRTRLPGLLQIYQGLPSSFQTSILPHTSQVITLSIFLISTSFCGGIVL